MRHKPKFGYKGLTIIMSHPSRFDTLQLMTGFAGTWFDKTCLQPWANRFQCDIRTLDTLAEGFLPDTKCLLVLGEPAMRNMLGITHSLTQQRGSPSFFDNIPAIPSFLPQDCMDMKASYEQDNNKALQTQTPEGEDWTPEDEDDSSGGKEHGKTKRSNWKFWLSQDVKKCIRIIQNNGTIPKLRNINTFLFPPAEQVIDVLKRTEGDRLYLDIETDCDQNLTCFGIGVKDNVYVVPFLRYNYCRAYPNLPRILSHLAGSFQKNEVIVHNSVFDLLVLAVKYRIPLPRKIYDTLLAQHRCFPEAEKSLGHCVSLWTYEQFHKDEGVFMPRTAEQEQKLWSYNAKDVKTMMWIREEIDKYALTIPGLTESIAQSNASVYPYILNTLLGIRIDPEKIAPIFDENERKMTQLLRILQYLVGHPLLPSSPKQCVNYFHYELNYASVARTDKGAPTLKGEAMYKLKVKYPENVAIDICLKYRELKKQNGTLKATHWNKMEAYQ